MVYPAEPTQRSLGIQRWLAAQSRHCDRNNRCVAAFKRAEIASLTVSDLGDIPFSRLDHLQFLFRIFARVVLAVLGSHLENLCAWPPGCYSRHQSCAHSRDYLGDGSFAPL